MTVHWTGKEILASAWMGQDTSWAVTVVVVLATSHHQHDFHAVMDSLEMSTGSISVTWPSKFPIWPDLTRQLQAKQWPDLTQLDSTNSWWCQTLNFQHIVLISSIPFPCWKKTVFNKIAYHSQTGYTDRSTTLGLSPGPPLYVRHLRAPPLIRHCTFAPWSATLPPPP